MPYRRIVFAQGEYYHLFNRGAFRTPVFYDEKDYHVFLFLLRHYAESHHVTLLVLCLMPNHFHLLVRVEEGGDVPGFMQLVCCKYSRYINERLRRVGTIWQGRYGSTHVDSNEYLLHLCRYIHANPIKAGLAPTPDGWTYSNFNECMGRRDTLPHVPGFIKGLFSSLSAYEELVALTSSEPKISHQQMAKDFASLRIV